MLFKSRLFRLVIILTYILTFIFWLTTLTVNPVVSNIILFIFLLISVLDLYTEFSLAKRNTKVFLLNSNYYGLLVYFVILAGIIILTPSVNKSHLSFTLFSAIAAIYNKIRNDLLFLEEGGYVRKGIFGLKRVNYSEISEVLKEYNILSFTSAYNLFQIDLSKMNEKEKNNFLKELKTYIPVKELI